MSDETEMMVRCACGDFGGWPSFGSGSMSGGSLGALGLWPQFYEHHWPHRCWREEYTATTTQITVGRFRRAHPTPTPEAP